MPKQLEMVLIVRKREDGTLTVHKYGDNLYRPLKLKMLDEIKRELEESKEDYVG